jgi:formate hydrogenlyase subunit 3/multisubunit Na+/H+ antiporter MnhD subunit
MAYNPLLILISLPITIGMMLFILPDRLKITIKTLAFLASLAAFALSVFVFIKKPLDWQTGQSVIFMADTLSSFIGLGVSFFGLLTVIYSIGFIERSFGRYFSYLLVTLGSSFAAAFANHLIVLLAFWGILAALLYLMINMQGTDKAAACAPKAFIIIGGTDAVMIFGITLIWAATGTFFMDKIRLPLNGLTGYAAYFSLAIASFAKAGAMPFHSWLPDTAESAPTPVTAYLPASVDKLLGIYMLIKASLYLFIMNNLSNTVLALAGSVTIILAVIFALVQHDMKRLLGYHAVSQVGYMILGIATGCPIGIAGGLFHMLNNAIYKSCLFMSGGNVEKRTGTTDLAKLGGLARQMPVSFACFLVAAFSISGVPPFNGFVSKWMIYQGIIESASPRNPLWILWLVTAMFGSALTVASFMKLIHAIFLGRSARDFKMVDEVGFSMLLPVVVLAAVCFIFGVFAFILPLPLWIVPSLGFTLTYIGMWSPVAAAVLIMIGILVGTALYSVFRRREFRAVDSFAGGEEMDSLERVTGTEFYNTLKDIRAIGALYEKEEKGGFDIYAAGKRSIYSFAKIFQSLHNGVLPTYLVWCLLGMMVMFLFMFIR